MSALGDELKEIAKEVVENASGIRNTFKFLTEEFKKSANQCHYEVEIKLDCSPDFSRNDFDYIGDGEKLKKLRKWCKKNKISMKYHGGFNYVFRW